MREKNFRIQVLCVLALIALASWPRFRPIKEQATVWRANPFEVRTQASSLDRRFVYDESSRSTFQITDPAKPVQSGTLLPHETTGRKFDDTLETAKHRRGEHIEGLEIVGRARTTLNEAVPYANLVLRNQETGAVEARSRADESGRFVFKNLPPGKYVIELVDKNGRVASAAPAVPSGQSNASGNVRIQQAQATLFVSANNNVAVTFGTTTPQPTATEILRTASAQDVTSLNTLDSGVSPRR